MTDSMFDTLMKYLFKNKPLRCFFVSSTTLSNQLAVDISFSIKTNNNIVPGLGLAHNLIGLKIKPIF